MIIWIIMGAVMLLSFLVQNTLQKRFSEYENYQINGNLSGAEVARKMLSDNGITDVQVVSVAGTLTDHYNPVNKTVNLSESVYNGRNVAAAAVAAHECGHVVQHAKGYLPLKLRTALVPVVNISNMAVQWVLLLGMLLIEVFPAIFWLGVALFAMSTLFSLVTLPVEINASSRAVAWLERSSITDEYTKPYAVSALKWAAYTYVIAAIGSLATLIYYIAIGNSRR